MSKKNETITQTVFRYGKAYLTQGGIFGLGKEALSDYLDSSEDKELLESLKASYDDWEYEEVVDKCDMALIKNNLDPETQSTLRRYKYESLFSIAWNAIMDDDGEDGFTEKTEEIVKRAVDYIFSVGEEEGFTPYLYYKIAFLYAGMYDCWDSDRNVPTRNYAIRALEVDGPQAKTALKIYEELTTRLFEDFYHYYLTSRDSGDKAYAFTSLHEYNQRKYIYIARDVKHLVGVLSDEDDWVINNVFTLNLIPADIVFPFGRPTEGIYMAHPVKTDHYYPIKNIDETLFMEKIREFSWLVQCLGATEIVFHSNKGAKVTEEFGSQMNVGGNLDVPKVKLGVDYNQKQSSAKEQSMRLSVDRVQHFHPTKKPYCPDDLVWFESDPEWKDIVKQRMQGSITDYTYKISASQTCMMSTSEKHAVEANVEYIETKVGGRFSDQNNRVFRSEDDTEWSIHIEFAPISQLTGGYIKNEGQTFTSDEQDYVKMYTEYASDGEISERDRRMLDKFRVRCGITEERARMLEVSCSQPHLTEDEQEYLEMIREYAADGEISERDRKMLIKMRDRMGISAERAKEIEAIV